MASSEDLIPANSVSVNTHHHGKLTVYHSFTPQGCESTTQRPPVILGANSQMKGVYTALAEYNISVSTAASPSWIDYYRTHNDSTRSGRNEVTTLRLIPGKALTAD
jgi:hypothetical protein